ncbi:FecR family protein [Paremcibacter congregatus]|uniref:FecR protein domain-containing protein n=1 Tax=Paremcibacter congregatus TaxID=2043170 RepID=A0A2G4YQZ2_9PROT|nr:FecR domain-containing protein [Paremcibacter congregatus]PHZ84741.1 hypothetical protein CRD36_10675 [Paremcibacter congregatus]QDE28934.1 DUF4880 domain-containing protein [Paremcibacter congregatus]
MMNLKSRWIMKMDKAIRLDLLEEAERWYQLFKCHTYTMDERDAFKVWYQENPDHQQAYAQVFSSFESGYDINDAVAEFQTRKASPEICPGPSVMVWFKTFAERWKVGRASGAFAVFAAMVLVILVSRIWIGGPDYTEYSTGIAQLERVKLPDGSVITLGAGSKIQVSVSQSKERRVIMEQGEALFAVARDTTRPFIVSSGDINVRVLGTTFNVHKMGGDVTVSLLEGEVHVAQEKALSFFPFLPQQKSAALRPAQQMLIVAGIMQPVTLKDINEMATWVQGQLNYSGARLSVVVADLNRYSDKPVIIVDVDLSALPVTAVFGTDQIGTFLEGLPHILPVELRRKADGSYLIFRRKNLSGV